MKRIVTVFMVAMMLPTFAAFADDSINSENQVSQLFKTLYYSGYPYAKVVDFQFKKIAGDTEYESKWETQIKIKSCFKLPIYCQSSIYITDKDGNIISRGEAQRDKVGTLFNKKIAGLGSATQIKQIAFNKKNLESYLKRNGEMSIYMACAPSLTHDQAVKQPYPPDHQYWDRFVQKNNNCNDE